eukprot:Clim_evm116s109 gene=Clim_evmTU116s109
MVAAAVDNGFLALFGANPALSVDNDFHFGPINQYYCGNTATAVDIGVFCQSWYIEDGTNQVTFAYPAAITGSFKSGEDVWHLTPRQTPDQNGWISWAQSVPVGKDNTFTLEVGFEGDNERLLAKRASFLEPHLTTPILSAQAEYFWLQSVEDPVTDNKLSCTVIAIPYC